MYFITHFKASQSVTDTPRNRDVLPYTDRATFCNPANRTVRPGAIPAGPGTRRRSALNSVARVSLVLKRPQFCIFARFTAQYLQISKNSRLHATDSRHNVSARKRTVRQGSIKIGYTAANCVESHCEGFEHSEARAAQHPNLRMLLSSAHNAFKFSST